MKSERELWLEKRVEELERERDEAQLCYETAHRSRVHADTAVLRLEAERDEARADLDFQNKEAERAYRGNQNRIGELSAEVSRLEGLILDWYAWEEAEPGGQLRAEYDRIRAQRENPAGVRRARILDQLDALDAQREEGSLK